MAIKKNTIIKWALNTLWMGIGAGVLVLLVAAVRKKDAEHCRGININIKAVNNNFFVDKNDILNDIISIEGNNPVGEPIRLFNLKSIEAKLIENRWIRNGEMFFDNNEILQVKITEKVPIARVFTNSSSTFYIDTSVDMLPICEKFSPMLPVFTGFPADTKVLSKVDSSLLQEIKTVSMALQKDSFCMALVDQIIITPQRTFEFVPKIGNNIIELGDTTDVAKKLYKLKVFYKEIMPKAGWSYYSVINLEFKNEVVAKRKGVDDKSADSLRTIQMMQQIAANAEKAADDSARVAASGNENNTSNINMINQSIQRDDDIGVPNIPEKTQPPEKPVNYSVAEKPKVVVKKPATNVAKPLKPQSHSVPVKNPVITKPKLINPQPIEQNHKTEQKKKPVSESSNDY